MVIWNLPWILLSIMNVCIPFTCVQYKRWFKAINFQKEWINLEPQANFDLLSCFKCTCLCLLTRLAFSFLLFFLNVHKRRPVVILMLLLLFTFFFRKKIFIYYKKDVDYQLSFTNHDDGMMSKKFIRQVFSAFL